MAVRYLERSRIVAPPGWSRWLVPPAALSIHLAIGQVYAWSVFKKPLEASLGISGVASALPITLVDVTPPQSVAEQDAEHGARLHDRDPDLCCALRKVKPLEEALAGYDAWATGLRRDETHNRVIAPVIGWDESKRKVKVSPLARWTTRDVEDYIAEHHVLVNPLQYDGYPSIGCWPCTRRVATGEDPRSGRWAGTGKTECGLHT